ncbi:MAG TPA: hypothetical protein VNP92_18510 [Actinophytocola sp.]|nr:hypothetical protein [Actinophytocola sp.]
MRSRRSALIDTAWAAGLTAVILGPLLTGWGFWLFGDMVFVPEQPWKDAWLGLDGTLPRAVPMDAIVSVLSQVLPGELVQRLLLVGAFMAGGIGAGLFVGRHGTAPRLAAITLMLWNPWVYERLLMGQWAILAGYLLLPWVALASLRMRRDLRRGAPAVAVAMVLSAVCSPSSGVMAALVVVVLGLRRRFAHVAVAAGLIVVANLSWLLPSLLADASAESGGEVFDAFAARGESALGTLPSLFSLGGTWKTSIVPEERTSVVIVLLSCALTVVALLGLVRRPRPRLLALAGISFLLAALPVLPGGAALLEALGDVVPATALLRDSHRFLAPAILALLPGIAGAVAWARARVRPGREAMWSVVGLLVLAPVLLLPSLAWGSLGVLGTSTYPDDWQAVADHLDDHGPGRSIVLPWTGSYRGFDWNDRRAVLDPAPRYLPGEVLVDDRIFVDGTTIPSEDPLVGEVTEALEAEDPSSALRELDVRWVVVEKGMPSGEVPVGETAYDGADLTLVDLGEEVRSEPRRSGSTTLILAGHILVTGMLLGSLFLLGFRPVRDGVE